MNIKINKVTRESSNNLVAFTTEYGNASGVWDGDAPDVDKEYFVELEIEGTLIWGSNIKKVEEEKYTIGMEGNSLYIVGCLESVEDDGYTVIRLGESIITLEVKGNPLPKGVFVKVEADKTTLFNVNY